MWTVNTSFVLADETENKSLLFAVYAQSHHKKQVRKEGCCGSKVLGFHTTQKEHLRLKLLILCILVVEKIYWRVVKQIDLLQKRKQLCSFLQKFPLFKSVVNRA